MCLKKDFDEVLRMTTEALKAHGFIIATTIDVNDIFKQKLNKNFHRYMILGACNPHSAYRAITQDSRLGLMLPGNVIIEQRQNDVVEVSAINPLRTLDVESFPHFQQLATDIGSCLKSAIDDLASNRFRRDRSEALLPA